MSGPAEVSANIIGINAALLAAEGAYSAGQTAALQAALGSLQGLVSPLENGAALAAQYRRLLSGRSAIDRSELDRALLQTRTAVEDFKTSLARSDADPVSNVGKGSGVHSGSRRYTVVIDSGTTYKPRADQTYISHRAGEHFTTPSERYGNPEREPELPKRGIFRMDTGMGKSVTYGYCIQRLRKASPEIFEDAVVVMAGHQAEPVKDLALQTKALFPGEEVTLLRGGIKQKDLQGTQFVVGTYQQLAQQATIDLLKQWAGKRRILFVLDEADMVVFKGVKAETFLKMEAGEGLDDSDWHPSWFRPFIEFGLFDDKGKYNSGTRHYMLGGTATLDRPDGISLSTVWGPGNVFYHTPMAAGVRKGLLVPVVGRVLEMDIPEGADPALYREFTTVTKDGRIVVDKTKVTAAADSDYAVKVAVRAVVDHMIMEVGVGKTKGLRTRLGLGYASDKSGLEKHMRWQRELFDLIETLFVIQNGLTASKPMQVDTILKNLGGKDRLDSFGKLLEKFLYSREWKIIAPMFNRAKGSLTQGKMDFVKPLFTSLYETLHVDARRIKGRPLVATAVWEDMDYDSRGRKIPKDRDRNRHVAVTNYPNIKWPNRFGDRDQTMQAFKDGEIDMVWSIGMLDRGFNAPRASLIVDNSPTDSRRMVVQRLGRIMRPPDGKNPTDHSQKPDAVYITVTPNAEQHSLDLSRYDVAAVFGMESDPTLRIIKITAAGPPPKWTVTDSVQLDLGDGKTVHLVRVGAETAKAVQKFLFLKYGMEFDVSKAAFDAGIVAKELEYLLKAIDFPTDRQLRHWLKMWGADDAMITKTMGIFHSDLAEMKTVYGGSWKIVRKGGQP